MRVCHRTLVRIDIAPAYRWGFFVGREMAKAAKKKAGGAHAVYDRAVVVPIVCERLSGGETLSSIARDLGMTRRVINMWRKQDAAIDEQMQDAKDAGYDAIAERVRETARGRGDSTNDVQRDKLIVDTDLKLLAKWDPRRYGDALKLSGDPESPLAGLTDAQVDERLAVLLAKRDQNA